jgi:hypothetical protein
MAGFAGNMKWRCSGEEFPITALVNIGGRGN